MTRGLHSRIVIAALLLSGVIASPGVTQNADPTSPAAAIADLSHVTFARRQAAYLSLIKSGKDAIPSLEQAAGGSDFNVAERCVRALAEITRDVECTEAALMALDRLAGDETKRVAKLAESESRRLRMSKEELAVEALSAAGVRINRSTRGVIYSIQIARDQDLFWLKFLPRLRMVSLSGKGITDRGLLQLFDCNQLTDLSFNDTSVTDAGLTQLHRIPSLTGLHLSDNAFTANGIRQLKSVKGLTSFSWFAPVDSERLQAMGELQSLTTISLSAQQVTEHSIDVINRLAQLTKLHFTATGVTDLQCKHLARIKIATDLSLMQSPGLTLAGWEQLCQMNLRSLSTNQVSITDEALKCLGRVTTLKYLTLTEAPVSDEGLLFLGGLTNLRYVNLRGTNVTQDGADRLKKLLPDLRTLRFDSRGFTAAKAYSVTTAIDQKIVHLRTALTKEILQQLQQEKGIHSVYMTRIGSTDQQIRMIATLPIKGLVVDSDAITDQGLAALKGHPHLRSLTITSNQLTDGCKDAILAIPSLSRLWIQKAGLTDSGVQSLIKGFSEDPQLTALNFGSCPQITNEALDGIAKLTSLSQLTLRDNPRLDSAVLRFVREMPELTEIRLEGSLVQPADLQHLRTLKLERLHFSNASLVDGAIAALADACPDLKQLGLAKSNLEDAAMASIGKLKRLEWLWLYGTPISDGGLEKLDDLKHLKRVYVSADTVSPLGEQRFRQQHPAAILRRN